MWNGMKKVIQPFQGCLPYLLLSSPKCFGGDEYLNPSGLSEYSFRDYGHKMIPSYETSPFNFNN